MAPVKSSTLTFRIEPSLKEALRRAANQEHRSIANMVEVMIREYCGRVGVAIGEQLLPGSAGPPVNANQKRVLRGKKKI